MNPLATKARTDMATLPVPKIGQPWPPFTRKTGHAWPNKKRLAKRVAKRVDTHDPRVRGVR